MIMARKEGIFPSNRKANKTEPQTYVQAKLIPKLIPDSERFLPIHQDPVVGTESKYTMLA